MLNQMYTVSAVGDLNCGIPLQRSEHSNCGGVIKTVAGKREKPSHNLY